MKRTSADDDGEFEEAQEIILDGIAEQMAERLIVGKVGAFLTDDPDADGYYLVKWDSVPYTLQEDTVLEEFKPPVVLKSGELVCEGRYFNRVPRAKQWYTSTEILTSVRMKQVVATDIELEPISITNKLPRTCDVKNAKKQNAMRVSDAFHDAILEEIHKRDLLDHCELSSLDEDFESENEEMDDEASLSAH